MAILPSELNDWIDIKCTFNKITNINKIWLKIAIINLSKTNWTACNTMQEQLNDGELCCVEALVSSRVRFVNALKTQATNKLSSSTQHQTKGVQFVSIFNSYNQLSKFIVRFLSFIQSLLFILSYYK